MKKLLFLFTVLTLFFVANGAHAIAKHLIITEIAYDPDGTIIPGEFVEIFNPTGSTISVSNWTINDNAGSQTFSATIGSGDYYVFGDGAVTNRDEALSLSLNNVGGDRVILKDDSGTIKDGVYWEGNNGWSLDTGASSSLSLCRIDTDSSEDESEWIDSCTANIGDGEDQANTSSGTVNPPTIARGRLGSWLKGCKDIQAENYKPFIKHEQSKCKYSPNTSYIAVGKYGRLKLEKRFGQHIIGNLIPKKSVYTEKEETLPIINMCYSTPMICDEPLFSVLTQ